MHRQYWAILLGFFYSMLLASCAVAKDETDILTGYETTQVAAHTWYIPGPRETPNVKNKGFMNNPAFVITDKSVIVLDPGSSLMVGKALIKRIRKLTKNPITHVFNSHVHGDHWLANQAFVEENKDVKIYAHPNMIEEAKNGEAKVWIDMMMDRTKGITKDTVATIPTEVLKDQQEIKVDNITIKAHLANIKAHTDTDAMFEIVEDKVLITGDNAFNKRATRMDDGSFVGNMKVMDDALKLPVEVVIPGHGPSGGKELLSNFKHFLELIYNTTKTAMDDDLEVYEIKPKVVEKMAKYQDWTGYKAGIGKLVGVAALEVEASDF